MKITRFISDQKWLLCFYVALMIFITAVVYADPQSRITLSSLLYLHGIGLLFLLLYLGITYTRQRNYLRTVAYLLDDPHADLVSRLPSAQTGEQEAFFQLIALEHRQRMADINKLEMEKKEWIDFTTSWFHDIKTPIAVARLLLEDTRENVHEQMESLQEELDRIEFQVEQALYYARADEFSKDYFIQEIDLEKLVKATVKSNAKTFIHKQIQIELNCEPPLEVLSDGKWLTFIINQALVNALKYTPNGGKIKISTTEDERAKYLSIWDNGIGIQSEDLNRVFEKGFTGYNGRGQHQKATGMGLFLAKKLAEKLGHHLTITSIWDQYTEVTILFPRLIDFYQPSK
ncbi:hypothetical protein BEP19_09105 [Ammoniphilus oxalaticus]|uniref:histidine kinase n=2 Tax=Ammoniphilus oxalaticus TaxID=66863 RepID=A0A419SL56_9BACL|nr:hypothetical protein BEP19_09105 [Ammoniphilus oxalaticus]